MTFAYNVWLAVRNMDEAPSLIWHRIKYYYKCGDRLKNDTVPSLTKRVRSVV